MNSDIFMFVMFFFVVFVAVLQVAVTILLVSLTGVKRENRNEPIDIAESKSHSIIHRAMGEARRMLVSAEIRGIRLVAQEKLATSEAATNFQDHLERVEADMRSAFDTNITDATKKYQTFVDSLEQTVRDMILKNEETLGMKVDATLGKTEVELRLFVKTMEEAVKRNIEAEFSTARDEVAQYKEHRLRVLDEKIVDVLQDVVEVALEKKLDLSEQSELVYRALEAAKRDNAFSAGRGKKDVTIDPTHDD